MVSIETKQYVGPTFVSQFRKISTNMKDYFVRFKGCVPKVETEGYFTKELPQCATDPNTWDKKLDVFKRLSNHHTLASIRRYSGFISTQIPQDELDFVLAANYDPATDIFADKVDVYLQPETMGVKTWRRLRNNEEVQPEKPLLLGHPLKIGGIKEKRNPNNVKLLNSGPHSPQTNAGYIRNGQGGNTFYY